MIRRITRMPTPAEIGEMSVRQLRNRAAAILAFGSHPDDVAFARTLLDSIAHRYARKAGSGNIRAVGGGDD